MVAVPTEMPETTPVGLTLASVLPVLHTPPGVIEDNVIVAPTHTVEGPVIGATVGAIPTVTR